MGRSPRVTAAMNGVRCPCSATRLGTVSTDLSELGIFARTERTSSTLPYSIADRSLLEPCASFSLYVLASGGPDICSKEAKSGVLLRPWERPGERHKPVDGGVQCGTIYLRPYVGRQRAVGRLQEVGGLCASTCVAVEVVGWDVL